MHFYGNESKFSFAISKGNKSMNGFVYLFHKELLNTSYALGIALGAGNTAVNKLAKLNRACI